MTHDGRVDQQEQRLRRKHDERAGGEGEDPARVAHPGIVPGVHPGDVYVDPALVRAVQRGEKGAMDDLIKGTYADVYSLSRRLLGDPADAADATQEVYLRVVKSVLGFRGEAAFGTWLHRVKIGRAHV